MALAMALDGAKYTTKEELQQILELPEGAEVASSKSLREINDAFKVNHKSSIDIYCNL